MRTLLYQCPSGLSGDMNLGAMVSLGVDVSALESELAKLNLAGWRLRFANDSRGGISGVRCDVHASERHSRGASRGASDSAHSRSSHQDHAHASHEHAPASHRHDSHHSAEETHHGHEHGHHHEHHHHGHHEHHEHGHHHGHHEHGHHRTFGEIRDLIQASELSHSVKRDAVACFTALAKAEAAVHGVSIETVHFHEVGAVDSIVDIVGAAICWELLGVEAIACSSLELGGGTVRCAHGVMPVPAPATARLLEGVPATYGAVDKETTTPTGAALLMGKKCQFGTRLSGVAIGTGVGIGQRNDPRLPNVVYVTLIDSSAAQTKASFIQPSLPDILRPAAAEAPLSFSVTGGQLELESDRVIELATNLDDTTPEEAAFLCERLANAGALDVWQAQATFKKGRCGIVVHALAYEAVAGVIRDILFLHSSTLGVRMQLWHRSRLSRSAVQIDTPMGSVQAKISFDSTRTVRRAKVEFDERRRLALQHGLSLEAIEHAIAPAVQASLKAAFGEADPTATADTSPHDHA